MEPIIFKSLAIIGVLGVACTATYISLNITYPKDVREYLEKSLKKQVLDEKGTSDDETWKKNVETYKSTLELLKALSMTDDAEISDESSMKTKCGQVLVKTMSEATSNDISWGRIWCSRE